MESLGLLGIVFAGMFGMALRLEARVNKLRKRVEQLEKNVPRRFDTASVLSTR